MKRTISAFTLIELLIVVAIIGILAAIAIPNFLNAQARAKVSRTKADLNSLGIAMEEYQIDWEGYPPDWNDLMSGPCALGTPYCGDGYVTGTAYRTDMLVPTDTRVHVSWDALRVLSTPTEFISTVPYDAFIPEQPYSYDSHKGSLGLTFAGSWLLIGIGPDLVLGDWAERQLAVPRPVFGLWYDPTNGTISMGDIWRTIDGPSRYAIEF